AIDMKRIERWYNEKGFYEAKVENVEELRDDKGRVTLLVKINEGRRAVVRKMEFTGADALPHDELSDIDDALPIHPGDAFDEDVYEKAKDVLLDQLREHGFARARVRGPHPYRPPRAGRFRRGIALGAAAFTGGVHQPFSLRRFASSRALQHGRIRIRPQPVSRPVRSLPLRNHGPDDRTAHHPEHVRA